MFYQLLVNGVMNGWVNQCLVDDPTAVPPGFSLPRHLWAKLNHFRTGQGQCAANRARWRKIPDPSCSCGAAKQTMSHIVNDCRPSRFPGGLTTLHLAGDEAINWLGMQCKRYYNRIRIRIIIAE